MSTSEIAFDVDGYPPAKSEALSMLGQGHRHARRVTRLLEAARDEVARHGFTGFGSAPIGMDVVVRCRRGGDRSDATNFLGGIGDVLEGKAHRGQLPHLGDLHSVALYDNDRQIEEVHYRWEDAVEPSYRVRFWQLGDG